MADIPGLSIQDVLAQTPLIDGKDAVNARDIKTREEARKLADEFEALFVQEMLTPVFDQIETDGPFGGGQAEAAFRPMLLEQYSRSLVESGGIGVADAVMTEILRMQGLEE